MCASPSRRSRIASRTLQVAVAAGVMVGVSPDEMWTLPLYGVAILAVPPLVGGWCRSRLGPLQRTWVSVALALHPVGALYDLYVAVPWYDNLAHLAAGSLVAGLAYAAVGRAWGHRRGRPVPVQAHLVVLLVVVTAAVGWELFELQVSYLRVPSTEDTLTDFAFTLLGFLGVAPRLERLLPETVPSPQHPRSTR